MFKTRHRLNGVLVSALLCTIDFALALTADGLPQLDASTVHPILSKRPSFYDKKYGFFSEELRQNMLKDVKEMFHFGYDSYMTHAFPKDELNPIYCTGRGPDYDNPSNININDVLGDYSLTLVDALDTLAVMGNISEFQKAVKLVVEHVSFDKNITVQVFEANIRILGALLSAHLLITDANQPFGDLKSSDYDGELLKLSEDLAKRLIPAFHNTKTGIPYPRVNLRNGVPTNCAKHTCTAGAGSLLLEFGVLSNLLQDPVYEMAARRATKALWHLRSKNTGLLGNVVDVETGEWIGKMSGVGAGLDSFYEYLLKVYILFGEEEDFYMFNESYKTLKRYVRKGRTNCNFGEGEHPLYVNVNMFDGSTFTLWIDSLQAAFAGIQVLNGDMEEAICTHALYYSIWKKFGALPERFNWQQISPDLSFYPLRPELVESTYFLYQATKNPFYLHVGKDILESLNNYTKTECGYATIHNVQDKSLEDRMESFFLSETCKYLYLLFDFENPVNKLAAQYIFTTEGHLFPISERFRNKGSVNKSSDKNFLAEGLNGTFTKRKMRRKDLTIMTCDKISMERQYFLPLKTEYFVQVNEALGVTI